jgi:hypothetical protein
MQEFLTGQELSQEIKFLLELQQDQNQGLIISLKI